MTVKYKVSDFAKDLSISAKKVLDELNAMGSTGKKNSSTLEENELNYLLEKFSKDNSVKSLDEFLNSAKAPKAAPKPAEKQAEQNKKDIERVARLKKASLMDEKLREASFDSFQVTKYNARNLKLCRRYAEAFDEMVSKNQGLIFWGSVGTGKSFAAACIANHLLNRGVPVMMTSLVKLLELIQGGEEKESDISARMNSAKLVIVDDLGAERNTDYALEKTYNIIDSRYRRKLPRLLTTILTIDEMKDEEDRRHSRIYDRIFETCYSMQCTGPSWRKKEASRRFTEMEKLFDSD